MKDQLESYFDRLWPICRSITGNGLRESLKILSEIIPLEIYEVPTGTKVFDWEVPKEWNVKDAWIETPDGKRIAEFSKNNLHLVNYSIPVDREISFEELAPHLHTLKNQPEAIPYVTSYYRENWGFCITENEFQGLEKQGLYKVYIDSSLEQGSLTYGEAILEGETDEEILLSTYLCHPSMANNELSGPLAQAFLYKELASLDKRKYTYRFVFAPETIGIIAYLDRVGDHLKSKLKAGYVFTCCADNGNLTYKRSKNPQDLVDRIPEHLLKTLSIDHEVVDFAVGGSDERQYCSPGFNLPVGSIMRTPYQNYKEYHTSLDNKEFISFQKLQETVEFALQVFKAHELNEKYQNKVAFCEPQLGKRGLYPSSVNPEDDRRELHNLLHLLSFADGNTELIDIADKRGVSMMEFEAPIKSCKEKGLL